MAEQKIEKDRKIYEDVFDTLTIRTLQTLIAKKKIDRILGIIKSGKEAQVFRALTPEKKLVVVKIYLIETSSFQNMADYIKGDYRFKNVGKNKRRLVYLWCAKEFRNLKKAHNAKISVPNPIAFFNNALVMEYIGNQKEAAPLLADIKPKDPKKMFSTILKDMKKLYFDAGLVHADLSQYNILVKDEKPIMIDMGQSVILKHPMAEKFLERDVKNIVNYFNKQGLNLDHNKILKQFEKKL